jgi:hypothetical protein
VTCSKDGLGMKAGIGLSAGTGLDTGSWGNNFSRNVTKITSPVMMNNINVPIMAILRIFLALLLKRLILSCFLARSSQSIGLQ